MSNWTICVVCRKCPSIHPSIRLSNVALCRIDPYDLDDVFVFALVMEESVRDACDNKFATAHLKALTHRKNWLLIPASNPRNTLSCLQLCKFSHDSDSGY